MRKMKDVFGAGLSTLLILSMVLGSTTVAIAKADPKNAYASEFNSAYTKLLDDAKKLDSITAYTGTDGSYGTEKAEGSEEAVKAYWEDADKVFELYAKSKLGADEVKRADVSLDGKSVALGDSTVEVADESYTRAYEVTVGDKTELYNIHIADRDGNISFWKKSKNDAKEIKGWAKVIDENGNVDVTDVFDESTKDVYTAKDSNDILHVAYGQPTNTSTYEYNNYTSTLAANKSASKSNEQTTFALGDSSNYIQYNGSSFVLDHETKYGKFLDFSGSTVEKAKEDILNWLSQPYHYVTTFKKNLFGAEQPYSICSLSEWNQFNRDGSAFLGLSKLVVRYYIDVENKEQKTINHGETGIIVTKTAKVKTTTSNVETGITWYSDDVETIQIEWDPYAKAEARAQKLLDNKLEEFRKDPHVKNLSGETYLYMGLGYAYRIFYDYDCSFEKDDDMIVSQEFYKTNKYKKVTVKTIPAYYTEKQEKNFVRTIKFTQEKGDAIATVYAVEGTDITNVQATAKKTVKQLKDLVKDKNLEVSKDLTKSTSFTKTDKWKVADGDVYDLTNITTSATLVPVYNEGNTEIQFGISAEGEVYENGGTQYNTPDYIHLSNDFNKDIKVQTLKKYEGIFNSMWNEDQSKKEDFEEEAAKVNAAIINNVNGKIPTLQEFLENPNKSDKIHIKDLPEYRECVEKGENFTDIYTIRWYVLKLSGNKWKMDGTLVKKEATTTVTFTSDEVTKPYDVVNLIPGEVIGDRVFTFTESTKEQRNMDADTFRYWLMEGDESNTHYSTEDIAKMKFNENTTFKAVFEKHVNLYIRLDGTETEENGGITYGDYKELGNQVLTVKNRVNVFGAVGDEETEVKIAANINQTMPTADSLKDKLEALGYDASQYTIRWYVLKFDWSDKYSAKPLKGMWHMDGVLVKKPTATFINDGKEYAKSYVTKGNRVSAPEKNPTKRADAQYEYEFLGWAVKGAQEIVDEDVKGIDFSNDEAAIVNSDVEYVAVYKRVANNYNLFFYNGDEVVFKDKVEPSGVIKAPEKDPAKEGDTNNEFAFVGWGARANTSLTYRSFANMTFKVFDDMGLVKDGLLEFEAVYSKNIPIHNLKFDTDHGQITIGVEHGSTLAEELIPQNSNVPEETLTKVFFGWRAIATPVEENVVTGASLLKVNFFRTEGDPETFNFSTPIEHDYEFEAVYVDVDKIRVSFFDGNTQVGDTQYVTPEENVQAPTATRVDTETVTNTFLGYRMNGEGDILTVEQINQMNFEADTRFEAAFDVQEVQGAEFENPDDDGEVLGEEFTNPDANTNEQSEVLGASYGKTGDATPIFVVVALLAMSGITLVAFGKRRKENN